MLSRLTVNCTWRLFRELLRHLSIAERWLHRRQNENCVKFQLGLDFICCIHSNRVPISTTKLSHHSMERIENYLSDPYSGRLWKFQFRKEINSWWSVGSQITIDRHRTIEDDDNCQSSRPKLIRLNYQRCRGRSTLLCRKKLLRRFMVKRLHRSLDVFPCTIVSDRTEQQLLAFTRCGACLLGAHTQNVN